MSTIPATAAVPMPTPVRMDFAAGLLSYLVPGLGQLVQGRISKGLLFLFGVYGLFFYGWFLGQWQNVYFGDTVTRDQQRWSMPHVVINLYNRPQFAGQFWIGMAAWPAAYHYWSDPPTESMDHRMLVKNLGEQSVLKRVQVAVPEETLNTLQREGDKRWDLGWVYTVIAGVLNILVIYDALAGPAFLDGVPDGKGGRPA